MKCSHIQYCTWKKGAAEQNALPVHGSIGPRAPAYTRSGGTGAYCKSARGVSRRRGGAAVTEPAGSTIARGGAEAWSEAAAAGRRGGRGGDVTPRGITAHASCGERPARRTDAPTDREG